MSRRGWLLFLPLVAGCWLEESATPQVPGDPFHATPPAGAGWVRAPFAPPSSETAARVEAVGRKILLANASTGVRPVFRTIGAPQPEIFHVGAREVDVTEGLVNGCKSEAELAAVLCHELGKMVSEREALAGPRARSPDREPPPEVRVGNDYVGGMGSADQTRLAELSRYEKERRRSGTSLPPPDPRALARNYLVKAGYPEAGLDAVAPLLQAAAANTTFEKQLTPAGPGKP